MRRATLCLALSVTLSACLSGEHRPAARNPDVIVATEMAELRDLTALEAIRRLRPAWLSRRTLPGPVAEASGATHFPEVFIDGLRQTDSQILTRVRAREVEEIRFLDGPEATTRFGTGFPNGAILIVTNRGG